MAAFHTISPGIPRFAAAALAATLLCAQGAFAASTVPLSLERMSRQAETIFQGRVVRSEVRRDEASGSVATYTTFELGEIIKHNGDLAAGDRFTIKQVGGSLPGSGRRLYVPGVPAFTEGEEYIVFLPAPSRFGFSSPLGLSQGRFRILEQDGVKSVTNGRAVSALRAGAATAPASTLPTGATIEAGLQPLPGKPAQAGLDAFLSTVRSLSE